MPARFALMALVALTLLPSLWRACRPFPYRARACEPDGRGEPPRHWVGCRGDPGPRRDLDGRERVLFGLTLDPNQASAEDLAAVPGLSPTLAAEIVADREARGPFERVEALRRVRGIGPARLGKARAFLEVAAPEGVPLRRPERPIEGTP
ncbi:MAG TPA: helix-hairpin-helix domain-containing protein [Anaeromyxobacteraceae bacterium]|nr:helix-hairpin-helix domain-containing protein [Anaeromyxobacteraceae bacterium]